MSSILLRLLFLVAWLDIAFSNHATIQEIPHKLVRFPLVGLRNTTVESVTTAQIGIGKPSISVVELEEVNLKEKEGTTEQILLQTLIKMDSELRASQNSAPSYDKFFIIISLIILLF